MSENTIRTALRRRGYSNDEMTAHGFRAMARALMIERLPGISAEVIEAQLAHGKSGLLGMAYDRAQFMVQRRKMMGAWADIWINCGLAMPQQRRPSPLPKSLLISE